MLYCTTTGQTPFNGLFSRTTRKVKPVWILMKQEMMEWQCHQLDHMQIICTSLKTNNHASTLSLNFLRAGCSSWHPTNSPKALKTRPQQYCTCTHKTNVYIETKCCKIKLLVTLINCHTSNKSIRNSKVPQFCLQTNSSWRFLDRCFLTE